MKKMYLVPLALAGLLGACAQHPKIAAPPVTDPTPVATVPVTPAYGSVTLPPTTPAEPRVDSTLPPPPPAPRITATHTSKSLGSASRSTGTTVAAAGAHPKSYTIKKGDTLSGIAQKFYGKAAAYKKILAANPGMKADKIIAGTTIKLP